MFDSLFLNLKKTYFTKRVFGCTWLEDFCDCLKTETIHLLSDHSLSRICFWMPKFALTSTLSEWDAWIPFKLRKFLENIVQLTSYKLKKPCRYMSKGANAWFCDFLSFAGVTNSSEQGFDSASSTTLNFIVNVVACKICKSSSCAHHCLDVSRLTLVIF